jgi:hypothetical protein
MTSETVGWILFAIFYRGAPYYLGGQSRVVGVPDGVLPVHHWHIDRRRRMARRDPLGARHT